MKLSRTDVLLMAFCTGLIVANIYYCQPLVILVAQEFGLSESHAGKITYLTQAGYALGLFLIVPLGDMFERRKQILMITGVAVAALLLAALSHSFLLLQIASVLIGASSIVPQLILPMAANLSSDEKRGETIGIIMSGLLVGILASRAISGSIGFLWGWRTMYFIAAGICSLLLILMAKRFPLSMPSFKGTYQELMSSMWHYVKTQPVLREASIINFLAFSILSAFWTTMVLFLANPPFSFQTLQIGLFGIAGAAGALAAPLVGKLSSGKNPRRNLLTGLILQLLSIAAFYFTGTHLYLFIAGIILIDIGQQAIHVTNQTRIYALLPEARNRLNTVFMSVSFVGASFGSALGLWLWDKGQWPLFCIGTTAVILLNICIYKFYSGKLKT
ncbi:Predicted arabinose efflux permease, MFS family [Pedobacter steynii]|uniref:Predicted arabinose efflux permease, MFS family n=1 Tax=Pedobacter steynii TaxID=430522 RepID=A0A1H0HGB3_9SPHI|nr:MFS transporter [Pedobacter steynii]NQX42619.1 MFS transporter [Pedobacter steynii]SDO18198.1 Predicted arabinose efflux permease, MFS family [Pedobacter steynii]